eukprot:681216-Amphidinium_carterae.1
MGFLTLLVSGCEAASAARGSRGPYKTRSPKPKQVLCASSAQHAYMWKRRAVFNSSAVVIRRHRPK